MVFGVGAPYLTKCEMQMVTFSVVNVVLFNTYARIQKVHRPESLTLDARYDCWEHPFLELITVLVGIGIGLLVVYFPYGQWAIDELRARMEYQSRAISALGASEWSDELVVSSLSSQLPNIPRDLDVEGVDILLRKLRLMDDFDRKFVLVLAVDA